MVILCPRSIEVDTFLSSNGVTQLPSHQWRRPLNHKPFTYTSLVKTLVLLGLVTVGACSSVKGAAAAKAEPTADSAGALAIDPKYSWDLSEIYADTDAWESARLATVTRVNNLKTLKGSLGQSAQSLLNTSDEISETYKDAVRLLVYATLLSDEDKRIAENVERNQLARALLNDLRSATSWYSPEILAMGEPKVRAFIAQEPQLTPHVFDLEDTLRRAAYTLSQEVESVIAQSGKLTGGPKSIYSVMANANMPWEEVTMSDGEKVTLSQSGYSSARQVPNRIDRKQVFETFWQTWKNYEATFGTVMNTHINGLAFQTQVREYDTSVGRALFGNKMPEAVYRTLVEEVNTALPTLHRYFKLRKRMLGMITRRALEPLGDEYMAGYDAGVLGRWMHVYPQPGKRSGAYMFGAAYDVHPYVLLNHNNDYESASTFAHEYGHAVHSVLANKTQPWETAGYATFIAETASIMNEMLLQDLVVSEAQTDDEKLYYLGTGLEALRGTFFRQTMFAEFELKMNEEVEAGNVLTGAKLSEFYLDLLKRYHGHDEGVLTVDDLYGIEWAYIPHFYNDFYVFQYATSIAAAAGLAEKISAGDETTQQAFITMLKAGGSDYPYDLMKAAGLDMASPEPYRALVVRMNAIMDEMEAILASQ
jgi:oligoendopeptidase F